MTFKSHFVSADVMAKLVGHLMTAPDIELREAISTIAVKNVGDQSKREMVVKFYDPQQEDEVRAMLVHAANCIGEEIAGSLQADVWFFSSADREKTCMGDVKPRTVTEFEFGGVSGTLKTMAEPETSDTVEQDATATVDDELFASALALMRETRRASLTMFQRKLKIKPERAAELMAALEAQGIVGPPDGRGAREIIGDLGVEDEGDESDVGDECDECDECEDSEIDAEADDEQP